MLDKLIKIEKDLIVDVTQDTKFILLPMDFLSQEQVTLEFIFNKSGITAEIVLVYSLPVGGKLNVTTIAHHKVSDTSCLTKVRGVLTDGAISNYIGKIVIDKNAQHTSSFLRDDVLVVGKKTKNNSQPILTIEADDVKASHGATTGRINEEEIYYLQTRGLEKSEAEDVVVEGFLIGLINEILDKKIRDEVLQSVSQSLRVKS